MTSRLARILMPISASFIVLLSSCHGQPPTATVFQGPPTIIIEPDAFAHGDTIAGVEVDYQPPAPPDWSTVLTNAGIVRPWRSTLVSGFMGGDIDSSNVSKLQSLIGTTWIDTVWVQGNNYISQSTIVLTGVKPNDAHGAHPN